LVLNVPFSVSLKTYFKTVQHLKKTDVPASQGKKRRNTLCIASIFNAEWQEQMLFQAIFSNKVLPRGCIF